MGMKNPCDCCGRLRKRRLPYPTPTKGVKHLCLRCFTIWKGLDAETEKHPEWPVHRRTILRN
jgi:hypothetical protein